MATIDLLTKQTEAWDAWENPLITEIGYGGAAGGGKTRLGWYLIIDICENWFGAKCVVGRKELKTLRLTTLEELWTIFDELGYQKDRDYSFNASDNVLTFLSTGSEVLMLDMAYSPQDPNYTRFGSLPVTFGWADESNESPDKAVGILKTRVGRANLLYKVVINQKTGKPTKSKEKFELKGLWLETFNPNKGRVYRDFYKAWKKSTLPPWRVFIRALPRDNHHLPQSYFDNLERSDNTTRERLLKGNFDYSDDPQKIMSYAAITDLPFNVLSPSTKILTTGDVVPDPLKDTTKYLLCDIARFGGDKIVFGTFKGRTLYSLGVYTYQGIDESVRLAKQECLDEQVAPKNVLADEDGVGGGFVDLFKGTKGFHGNSAPTMIWDALKAKFIPSNYQNMRSQCYFMLAEGVNERLWNVKITKFQTNIEDYTLEQALSDMFEELDAIKETDKSDGGKKAIVPKLEIKDALGRSPDFADILMMRMQFELKQEEVSSETAHYHAPQKERTVVNKAR